MKNNGKFGLSVIRYRWLIIVATILIVIAVFGGMQRLAFNPDSRAFFSKENPQLAALEELENTYTETENIYIGIEPKKGDIFTREILDAVEELTTASWQIPYSNRVDWGQVFPFVCI